MHTPFILCYLPGAKCSQRVQKLTRLPKTWHPIPKSVMQAAGLQSLKFSAEACLCSLEASGEAVHWPLPPAVFRSTERMCSGTLLKSTGLPNSPASKHATLQTPPSSRTILVCLMESSCLALFFLAQMTSSGEALNTRNCSGCGAACS